jgi:hypothetical protein
MEDNSGGYKFDLEETACIGDNTFSSTLRCKAAFLPLSRLRLKYLIITSHVAVKRTAVLDDLHISLFSRVRRMISLSMSPTLMLPDHGYLVTHQACPTLDNHADEALISNQADGGDIVPHTATWCRIRAGSITPTSPSYRIVGMIPPLHLTKSWGWSRPAVLPSCLPATPQYPWPLPSLHLA